MSQVLFEELKSQSHFRIAVATLASSKTLNALNYEMVSTLKKQFLIWIKDPSIVLIFLQGEGEKAFCAGGDILRIYEYMKKQEFEKAEEFFREEYELDLMIRKSLKPIIVWGHGIVMGGGMGLFSAGQFRIATETSKFAMPEAQIGFFPDVGGSFFLSRMPYRIGLFLGLTSHRFNASDAKGLNLATHTISNESRSALIEKLLHQNWDFDPGHQTTQMTKIVNEFSCKFTEGEIMPHASLIEQIMSESSLVQMKDALREALENHPWLKKALEGFEKGSPTSQAVFLDQFVRGKSWSLEESFEQELKIASYFIRQPDFLEGIRALLVDKDGSPKWTQVPISKGILRDLNIL